MTVFMLVVLKKIHIVCGAPPIESAIEQMFKCCLYNETNAHDFQLESEIESIRVHFHSSIELKCI